jgi:hypothetical protein
MQGTHPYHRVNGKWEHGEPRQLLFMVLEQYATVQFLDTKEQWHILGPQLTCAGSNMTLTGFRKVEGDGVNYQHVSIMIFDVRAEKK